MAVRFGMRSIIDNEHDHIALIGERPVYGGSQPFGIRAADARQHVYVIGKTGTGKSTLLKNILIQKIEAGHGVGLIDPHGDLARDLLDSIPRRRTEDVVYFDPSDYAHPPSFNPLFNVDPDSHHTRASALVGAFKSIWRESWGPRLEFVLHAAIAALLECQNVSLLGVQRLLADERYRRWALRQVKDPAVKMFWEREFAGYDKRFAAEVIAPVQNKLGAFMLAAPLRNILGQVKSKIDPRFIMDRRKIFIANLAKGLLGEDKANLLGSLLVSLFQSAAMSRAELQEADRVPLTVDIDEFQNFTSDAFASILSESRKQNFSLVLSHQYIDQLAPAIQSAVFGNAGTLVSFRVGETDAAVLAREYGNGYSPKQFSDLPNHQALVRPLEHGTPRVPFQVATYPPMGRLRGRGEKIRVRSRSRYTSRRDRVEANLRRWMPHD